MTVTQLAQLMARQIAQGRGGQEVNLFQWEHGSQPLTDVIPRPGADVVELYSGTAPAPASPITPDLDDLI